MKKWLLLSALVSLVLVPSARADLVMSIDTNNETLAFHENDTGTLGVRGLYGWGDVSGEIGLSLSGSGLPDAILYIVSGEIEISGSDNSNSGNIVTFFGSGTSISYSSFSDFDKSVLEGHIGSTLIPDFSSGGSGFSPIRVTGAVPEPGTATMLGLLGLVVINIRRRR